MNVNRQGLLNYVIQKFEIKKQPVFRVGDTVKVHVKITEGDTTRIQMFEGIVISFTGIAGTKNFTVRKVSFGVGVERCFPLNSPAVEKIDVIRSGFVRRAKLYYLRDRIGRSARLEEKETVGGATQKSVAVKILPTVPPVKEEVLAAAKPK